MCHTELEAGNIQVECNCL